MKRYAKNGLTGQKRDDDAMSLEVSAEEMEGGLSHRVAGPQHRNRAESVHYH